MAAKGDINYNYASGVNEAGWPVYDAPAWFTVGGRTKLHPTTADYAALNPPRYPVPLNPAPSGAPSGYHYEFRSYEFAENVKVKMVDGKWVEAPDGTPHTVIHSTYALVQDPPPPPRRWSRLSIKTALAQAEMLAAARQYLSAVEIATDYTAWEALTDCDYIEEGYPTAERWEAILDGAAQALGKTREEVDEFLSNIPQEG